MEDIRIDKETKDLYVKDDLKGNFESVLLDKDEADGFHEMGFFWIGRCMLTSDIKQIFHVVKYIRN